MFSDFEYKNIKLEEIMLDYQNPRIVTPTPLKTQEQIVSYMFEHTNLLDFIYKISQEGKNKGAERPYIIASGKNHYIVIEGNTRITAYKILTGLLKPPAEFEGRIPAISDQMKADMLSVDCSIAPSRDTLFPIMANAHFGLGDKSKWGYLGSRQAIYKELLSGKSIEEISKIFSITPSEVRRYIIEYKLYLEATKFKWLPKEKLKLLDPSIGFNPPIRFLQGKGHKEKIGIEYDNDKLEIIFKDELSKEKYKHLVYKLIITHNKGLGATAKYDDVFKDFHQHCPSKGKSSSPQDLTQPSDEEKKTTLDDTLDSPPPPKEPELASPSKPKLKKGALFAYIATKPTGLLRQLAKEASQLDASKFPAAGTFLLRNIIESLLKEIIQQNNANPNNEDLSLEKALNICSDKFAVPLSNEDRKVLSQFKKNYLDYLNLGAHGNVIPNSVILFSARDCIDPFVRKHI